jgi:outer membrane biosynthesis protein TonB
MKVRNIVIPIIVSVAILTFGLFNSAFATPNLNPAAQSANLPDIEFLGEGPGTFTIDPPRFFLVKSYENGEFLFVTQEPPSYRAATRERVWSTNYLPGESIRYFHDGRSYGNVEAGCVVNFVQIEDNVDERRNHFYINGNLLHTIEQGMVTYGSFVIPEDGELTFFANDSIGIIVELCAQQVTQTPEMPTETATAEVPDITPTETQTPETPEVTPTGTLTVTPATPTPTETLPPQPVEETPFTPTATQPGAQDTPTPTQEVTPPPGAQASPTPTSTAPPGTGQTATPIPTPGALPVTGGSPGPREIAWMGAGLLALMGLLAAGWWRLLAWMRDAK